MGPCRRSTESTARRLVLVVAHVHSSEYLMGALGSTRSSRQPALLQCAVHGSLGCMPPRKDYDRVRASVGTNGCAAAYPFGTLSSNECPPNSVRIVSEAACQTAAAALGKEYRMRVSLSTTPRGCYANTVYFFLNDNPVGAAHSNFRLVCSAATAAPTNAGFTYAPTGALAYRTGLAYKPTLPAYILACATSLPYQPSRPTSLPFHSYCSRAVVRSERRRRASRLRAGCAASPIGTESVRACRAQERRLR